MVGARVRLELPAGHRCRPVPELHLATTADDMPTGAIGDAGGLAGREALAVLPVVHVVPQPSGELIPVRP